MARRNDVSPRYGAWATGTDVENATPNQLEDLRLFYGPPAQQEISLPGLRGQGPGTQFQVPSGRMPPMMGAGGLPIGYSPTPAEQERAKARQIAEQTSGVQKITGGVARPPANAFGLYPRGAAYETSSFFKKGGSEGEYQRQQAAPRAPAGDALGFAPRGPVYESPPFIAEQYAGTQKPEQAVTQRDVITVEKSPRQAAPRQAAPRGTGIFYSRSGIEGTQQQYVPGTLGEVTPEQRVQMAMQRFAPETAIGPNGQRMQLPTDREVGPYSPGAVANQQAIRRAAEGMSAGMFQTRGAREAAMKQGMAGERVMSARAHGGAAAGGLTPKEQGAYIRSLESLTGPQERERRKQEQAAERIAKASNPPQAVRGEKPLGPEEMVPRAKQYYDSVKDSVLSETSTYLSNQLTGMNDEEAKQILGILSGDDGGIDLKAPPSPSDTDMQRKRKNLYAIVLKDAGPEVADDLFSRSRQ